MILILMNLILFFKSVGEKLTYGFGEMRPPNISVPNCENIFKFIEINTNSTLRELLKLPMRTNLDIIDIDSYMLRLSAPAIAASLTHIFNLSLYHGSLPSDWKYINRKAVKTIQIIIDQFRSYLLSLKEWKNLLNISLCLILLITISFPPLNLHI